MANLRSDIEEINIVTAEKLDNEEVQNLSQAIYDRLNSNPKINIINDPNIIGGIKLRVGNKIFDNSVICKINQLKKSLHNM